MRKCPKCECHQACFVAGQFIKDGRRMGIFSCKECGHRFNRSIENVSVGAINKPYRNVRRDAQRRRERG